jgi:nicotinate-nucleotide pyrophosphorylase (carboxylating)
MESKRKNKYKNHPLNTILPKMLHHPSIFTIIELSLAEDLSENADFSQLASKPAAGDVTSMATLEPASLLYGRITAKAEGILAGLPIFQAVFKLVDPNISFTPYFLDGQMVQPGNIIADIDGPGISLLAGERTALNFLGRMSGVATLTRKFVDAVYGTNAVILDTRKTSPGLRHIDKYAVKQGGGENHRSGLYDMVLIKDNHIDGAGSIQTAVQRVRDLYGYRYLVEVEVKNLDELKVALSLPIDRIMLDNMDLVMMEQAVRFADRKISLEASGNVNLASVRKIAETGVDFISIGALTHSAPVLDISMRLR